MTEANLKPEFVELFREYRRSHREVFLEQVCWYVGGFGTARSDLVATRCAIRARSRLLGSKPGTQGHPRGSLRPSVSLHTEDMSVSSLDPHGSFKGLFTMCGDFGNLRPVAQEQTILFITEANHAELAAIRKAVAAREKRGWHSHRGRPGIFKENDLSARALRAVWMRYVERKKQGDISQALGMPDNSPDAKGTSVRRLEDYLAAMIYKAFRPEWQVHVGLGLEQYEYDIKPGILDDKTVQTYLQSQTGLPFNSHPEECKRIVTNLWPRRIPAYWKQLERHVDRKQRRPRP